MFRDQNKSECIRRNKQKNPVAKVRISSSKTLTRIITVNLFQPEISSKADSEMFNYTHALRKLHVVTILRLNHSKVVPAGNPPED